MNYLRSTRGRIILACFVVTSVFLYALPAIDIEVSRLFFDHGFPLKDQWWNRLLHESMVYVLGLSLLLVTGTYAFNRLFKRNLLQIDGRTVCYLFLVLILGAGLIVNVIFKEHFGRARPRDIEAFGGAAQFTPAFVISDQCDRNCSFSSGEGSGAFFFLALARALSRRRAALVAAVAVGCLYAAARVVSGAHFLSDTVVSFFVMLIVSDVLYYYMMAGRSHAK